ncbi:nuclease [Rhynchospora pubera]|uniref:Nuclease n=1 Tax=Rhynchospora pubera TaxID=906938 RepID=A0AAV8DSM7_9POAL|nr:nuclease [Rhynchospora pubera]
MDSDSDDEILQQQMQVAAILVMQGQKRRRDGMRACLELWKEVKNNRPLTGAEMITDQLQGHHERCYDIYRLSTQNFHILCNELKSKGLVCNGEVLIEEQVGMFLQLVGQASKMRKIAEDFQHSLETVWRCIRNVLEYVGKLGPQYIRQPNSSTPPHPILADGTKFSFFKDAIGAIDGTHIRAYPERGDKFKERFINRKGEYTQNVMAAVDFDGNFLAVVAGWEGSAHDNMILHSAMQRGVLYIPPGKYYLVDAGYANKPQFLAPYRKVCYHLGSFRDRARGRGGHRYDKPEELFNHRHAQLRNIVERTFGVVKARFHILKDMAAFEYKIQIKIVIACCILHNFINHHNRLNNVSEDTLFQTTPRASSSHNGGNIEGDQTEDEDAEIADSPDGDNLREHIKNSLWQLRQNP